MKGFSVEKYRDPESLRERWAVLDTTSRSWYFPSRYGKKAAKALLRSIENGKGESIANGG